VPSSAKYIPDVDPAEVAHRLERIRPLVLRKNKLWDIQFDKSQVDTIAFLWDAKTTEEATGLAAMGRPVPTFHVYGYYGFFKPSVGEVLRQVPADYLGEAVAFAITRSPDLNANVVALNDGYHVAYTQFYKRAQ
jgi:hypothetical protein